MKIKKHVSLIIALALLFSASFIPVESETADSEKGIQDFDRRDTYHSYLQKHLNSPAPAESIVINAVDYIQAQGGAEVAVEKSFEGKEDILVWKNPSGSVVWEFDIPNEGLYQIELEYMVLSESARKFEFELKINGETGFAQMSRLSLSRTYKDNGKIKQDNRGNDIRPSSSGERRWITEAVSDKEGIYSKPFKFFFKKGLNKIQITNKNSAIAFSKIRIFNQDELPDYATYFAGITEKGSGKVTIEAEKSLYKSDTVLFPTFDRSSYATQPNDPVLLKLNTIGQSNWQSPDQYIVWNVNVKKAGYYKIAIRYRQNLMRGLTTFRRLSINGEVPFKEADALPFKFSDKWQKCVLGDKTNGDYLFYFNAGDNELRMEVVPGSVGEVISSLDDISYTLNLIYRRIIMITGTQPDLYRDYQLDKEIPGLMDALRNVSGLIEVNRKRLLEIGGQSNLADAAAIMNTILLQLKSFIKKPADIPSRLTTYHVNISGFADFINSMKQQPLEIDYFVIFSPDTEGSDLFVEERFLSALKFHVKAFIGSFTADYTSVGSVSDEKSAITVWINLGRDQVQVVKQITDSLFVPKFNIPVNIKLVQQGLVPAILAGGGPDVALFLPAGDPVNLACRGGLVPVNKFEGFDSAIKQFSSQAMVPYKYKDDYYAMPITEEFPLLFYRTDIFEDLGIEKTPETWEEFYDILTVLQRNNMTAGIPNMVSGNQMDIDNSVYFMFLYQLGGTLYNEDLSATEITSQQGLDAFSIWTDLYRNFGLPAQYNFFQRFRTGDMPMGLAGYSMYNMLSVAAPELAGLWDMVEIPGIRQSDGTVINTAVAGGTCGVILSTSKHQDSSWKYLSWFTGAEAQAQYGLEIEAVLGSAGRYSTANLEAFEFLPWNTEQAKVINGQRKNIVSLPQIPGGYYVTRNLTNAFRKVVYQYQNPQSTLFTYNMEINHEISRKRSEFGLDKEVQ